MEKNVRSDLRQKGKVYKGRMKGEVYKGRMKGEVYKVAVRPAMLYGMETVEMMKRQQAETEVV